MAATITVACPECHKQIKAPAEVLGKKIRCKGCGHAFAVKAGPAKAGPGTPSTAIKAGPAPKVPGPQASPSRRPVDEEENSNPYVVSADEHGVARCPNCANELESEDAILCLFCGYNSQTRQQAKTRKVHETTGFDIFLWLLPGIACVLTILLLIGVDIWYCLEIDGYVKDEWYEFVSHGAAKMWVVIISLFLMYYAGRFAIKRLLIDNVPPEIEKKV
jgi:hypothetical protein